MKKYIIMLLLGLVTLSLKAQETPPPFDVNFKQLSTSQFYLHLPDSAVWQYKGLAYGWAQLGLYKDIRDLKALLLSSQIDMGLKEEKTNKVLSLNSPSDLTYPTTSAVAEALRNVNPPVPGLDQVLTAGNIADREIIFSDFIISGQPKTVVDKNIGLYMAMDRQRNPIINVQSSVLAVDGVGYRPTDNIGVGKYALKNNTGQSSCAFGDAALINNSGDESCGFGVKALYDNTGVYCNGFGYRSLMSNVGVMSSGFGTYALENNMGGYSNGFGTNALANNKGGYSNGVGNYALHNNVGENCNGFGDMSLYQNTGRDSNGFGLSALSANIGYRANGFGIEALMLNKGDRANGFGAYTLYFTTAESYDLTAIGDGAGRGSEVSPLNFHNSTAVGANSRITKSDQVTLGSVQTKEVRTTGSLISSQLILLELNAAPSAPGAIGVKGELRITSDFIYVCIATNTWVRTALQSW